MGIKQTSIACISGQSVCLELIQRGHDIERRLANAQSSELKYNHQETGIEVQKVDRDELFHLAAYMANTGYPVYRPMVDGIPVPLEVDRYDLIRYSLIIAKIDNGKIYMHGIEDDKEPRKGKWWWSDINWNKVKDDYDRGCYDKWNMRWGTIIPKTSIACISCQSVRLELTKGSERQCLAEAKSPKDNPEAKFIVLTVDRPTLVNLDNGKEHAPEYSLVVDGIPTAKERIKHYDLLHCSVIISKVVENEILMHGIMNGDEPRNGDDIDWKKVIKDAATKLGSKTHAASKPGGASSSTQRKTRG